MADGQRMVHLTARTVEEARDKAASLLQVAPDAIHVEVLAARRSGLFGLGAPRLDVRATGPAAVEPPPIQPARRVESDSQPRPRMAGWNVWCERGTCYLQIGDGSPTLEEVEDRVRAWPLDEYEREAVRTTLRGRRTAPVQIGRIQLPTGAVGGGPFFLKPTRDGMTMWAVPDEVREITAEDMYQALERAGVEQGVLHDPIEAAGGKPLTEPLLVARGTEATTSRDAAVEYLFSEEEEQTSLRPLVRDDGSVDYRELKPIFTVEPGQVVGRYIPALDGEPARDVFGNDVAAAKPGRHTPAGQFAGRDVVLAGNGIDLVASRAGRPVLDGSRINVVALYAITGDVDYSTGNVDFVGDVYVAGDVQPGFTVKATGSVRVDGMVDSASVESGRDLMVGGGIHGHGESKIVCGGDMSARFVDSADVECRRDVLVVSTIVRATITANGQVTVIGRGSIVGGKIRAAAGISCTTAGSAAGVATSLELDWLGAIRPGADRERELARYKAARIVIFGDAYPGVTVNVNGAKFPVRDQLRGVQFQATDRGIALQPA